MNVIPLFVAVTLGTPIAVFAVALAGGRWLRVAGGATAVIILSYLAILAATGIWASQCWRCQESTGSDSREVGFLITVVYYGVAAIVLIAITWFASWAGSRLRNDPSVEIAAR